MKVEFCVYFQIIQFYIVQVLAQSNQVGFVYNSIPYQSYDVQSLNGTSGRIKVSPQTGITVVAIGNAGIMIIDNKFNTYVYQSPDNSYIQCIQISKNGQFIFLGMTGKLGIFQLNQNDMSIKMVNAINVQDMTIVDVQFNQEEDIMFVVGYLGVMKWYDARNSTNIIELGAIDYSQDQLLFNRAAMSPDPHIFYIAADFEGLIAFKIDKLIQNNQLQVNLTRILTKPAVSSFTDVVMTSKNNYVFAIDRWSGIFIIYDLSQLILDGNDIEDKNQQLIQMVPANLGNNIGYTSSIALSLDDQFLYVGARSLGILIYNIQDPLNPNFFQQLQLTGQSFSLALSPKQNVIANTKFDNQFIYYSNSLSVAVFQKQLPTLFNNIPNLFNAQQSQFFIEGTAISKWRCAISSNNKYLLGAFDADSLCIFQIGVNSYTKSSPSTMKLQYQFSDSQEQILKTDSFRQFGPNESIPIGFYVDNIYFSKDGQYIYFSAQQSTLNVIAYKFKVNISIDGEYSFEYVKGLHYDQVYYCEEMNFSEDEQHAVMSFDVGIALVDMVKFEVISMYTNSGVIGTCCGAVLSHDKKHALAVVRNVGLFIYDTSDMANPKMVNNWRTNGGETLLRSKTSQIIYFLDGFNGLILLDSTKLPEIVVIGHYVSSGWTNYISFTLDEKYGIISTMDAGTLTLIDLTDKSNLRVIMKSTIPSQNSVTTCIDQTGLSYLFSINQQNLRLYNLQSQVQIHVERQLLSISLNSYTSISESDPFQVGLQYLVRFVVLYRQPNQIIRSIYYYQNLVLQDLPSWMIVDRSDQSNSNLQVLLQLNIPKECLDSQAGNKSFLTIVIQTCFQLDNTSFIFEVSDLTTTEQESKQIFNYLKQASYIDGTNCTTNNFDSTTQQYIDLSLVFEGTNIDPNRIANIQSYVTETFKRSSVYNQFVFDVISSLQFNQNQKSQMISAIQKDITVSFTFQEDSQYNFIQKIYPNLVMYFNDQLTVMKIEGDFKYINQALSNGVLYFDKSKYSNKTFNSSQEILVEISDNFNYNLNLNLNVESEVKFLKLKSDIIIQKTLQDQVNNQGTDLTIEESFLIQFDIASFVDPDQIPLTYQFQQQISGQFVPISSDSFIKCDNINLRLVGSPPSSYLFQTIQLRLQVNNGYTTKYENFYIKINKMPFSYVLNILIQVLGPIAFAFGLYKKRSVFMNLYFKNQTMYSTETAYVNQTYRKKILILDLDYEIAYLFLQKFLKQANKNQNQTQNAQNFSLTKKSILNLDSEKTINFQQNIENPDKSKCIEGSSNIVTYSQVLTQNIPQKINKNQENIIKFLDNNLTSQQVDDKESQNAAKKQLNEMIYSQFSSNYNNKEAFNKQKNKINQQSKLKKIFKDKYDRSFNMEQSEIRQKIQSIDKIQQNGISKNMENKSNIIQKNIIQIEDGTFQMENLFNQMIDQKLVIQYNLLDYKIEDYASDLQYEGSRFYYCLKANVLRYLLDHEKKTLSLYQFLKKYSLETGNYLQNDWYKQYVQITATNQLDKFGVPVPFSKTTLIEDEIFKVLKDLEIIPQNLDIPNYQLSYLQSIDINPYLLKEVLFADALGLDFVSSKNIIKCCGESIHLEKNQLVSVEAFEKIEDGVCLSLRKLFNLQYKILPISKYISLPSWMSYEFKNGVIILEGIPTKSDVNRFLIRVYDQSRFVSYQFHLNVVGESKIKSEIGTQFLNQQIKQNKIIKDTDVKLNFLSQQQNTKQNQFDDQTNNNSIMKESQYSKYFKKQQINLDTKSIQSSPNQNIINNQSNDNYDEIDENIYQGIKSMTEYEQDLVSPPIFMHRPSCVEKSPIHNLKLDSLMPSIQQQILQDRQNQQDYERDQLGQSQSLYDQQLNKQKIDHISKHNRNNNLQ